MSIDQPRKIKNCSSYLSTMPLLRLLKFSPVIRLLVAPQGVYYPDPVVGQRPHRFAVALTGLPLTLIVGRRPFLLPRRLPPKLIQRLSQWLDIRFSVARPPIVPTRVLHRTGPRHRLQVAG